MNWGAKLAPASLSRLDGFVVRQDMLRGMQLRNGMRQRRHATASCAGSLTYSDSIDPL
jgi:hypothetical protein